MGATEAEGLPRMWDWSYLYSEFQDSQGYRAALSQNQIMPKATIMGWKCSSVDECLPNIHKVLHSIQRNTKLPKLKHNKYTITNFVRSLPLYNKFIHVNLYRKTAMLRRWWMQLERLFSSVWTTPDPSLTNPLSSQHLQRGCLHCTLPPRGREVWGLIGTPRTFQPNFCGKAGPKHQEFPTKGSILM